MSVFVISAVRAFDPDRGIFICQGSESAHRDFRSQHSIRLRPHARTPPLGLRDDRLFPKAHVSNLFFGGHGNLPFKHGSPRGRL